MELSCYACGSTATLDDGTRCECGAGYWLDTDPSGFHWPESDERSLWRYADLLPQVEPAALCAAAGGTPLMRAPRLDEDLDCRVHLKYEGSNPTGTFKDRGSAVGVAAAAHRGAEAVATVSHGNMARSMAAHAASIGLECLVFVPESIPEGRLGLIARHAPSIFQVRGPYDALYDLSLDVARDHNLAVVNGDSPLRVAGQKTTTLEILERFAPDVPDAIVLPVSSGGHGSGAWKAVRECRAAGLFRDGPELYFIQAEPCAPIAEAWARGDDSVTAIDGGETIAYSIANANPPSGDRILAAARDTGGGVLAVSDNAILAARRDLAAEAGVFVESSCATTLAGARELAARGALGEADDVVLVPTGLGYTERTLDEPTVEPQTVDMADLGSAVADYLA
ncbi:MAG: threonine synthase [Salinirussus sp.]